jgi:hypothetical protein
MRRRLSERNTGPEGLYLLRPVTVRRLKPSTEENARQPYHPAGRCQPDLRRLDIGEPYGPPALFPKDAGFEVKKAAGSGLRIPKAARRILDTENSSYSTSGEIEAAFAALARDRPDALFVSSDVFFLGGRVQFATFTARDRIPAAYASRDYVEAGGLMSYGANIVDSFRQVGAYTGQILKGAKAANLPVLQATKFEFVINWQTARALGLEVPSGVLSIADEVIE